MILFPPAKINLGLNVPSKRNDGYHEIETCMVTIPVFDILEMVKSDVFSFKASGLEVGGSQESNLCVRAFRLMEEKYAIGPIQLFLRKEIPMGAGLGGGSADATYVLRGLNELFELNLSAETLKTLAAKLGSDCPFFVDEIAQFASGRGEKLEAFPINLEGYYLKLVHPGIHISTKEAYEGITFQKAEKSIKEILIEPIETWQMALKNDFEVSIFVKQPLLKEVKTKLINEGAIYAAMSGSGSCLFGIFKEAPMLTFEKENYYEKIVQFS